MACYEIFIIFLFETMLSIVNLISWKPPKRYWFRFMAIRIRWMYVDKIAFERQSLFYNFLRGLGWEVDLDKFMCKRIKFYSFEASMRPFIPFSIRAGLNFVSLRRMAFKNQLKKSTYLSKCWITLWLSPIFSSFIEKVLNILPFQGFPSSTRKFNILISIS